GVYLFDTEGKKYMDASSGAVTCSIGHGVPEIIDAMGKQANAVSFVYRSQFSSHAAEGLAKKLSEITPGDLNWTFLVN
ncbi:aminotransferase class III-fold pyridoxal phosphate-dependent enzyme, partial [Mycobacterium tuberculosis]|nr:aminotransferase class III-fold pyridoxal phosphate-dependent enzyme [Mycobacterium tuberculosis]